MEENKVNFLYPSPSSPIVQPNFANPICPLSHEVGLSSFTVSQVPRQVPISQIYTSRKIKHPSFRKRASSGTMPYYIPFKHRQRTKSENADAPNSQDSQESSSTSMDCENIHDSAIVDMDSQILHSQPPGSNLQFNKIKLSQLKKSKSLENLVSPKVSSEDTNLSSSNFSTLEFVSHRIQKLKFNE